jgi:hypothetical protein
MLIALARGPPPCLPDLVDLPRHLTLVSSAVVRHAAAAAITSHAPKSAQPCRRRLSTRSSRADGRARTARSTSLPSLRRAPCAFCVTLRQAAARTPALQRQRPDDRPATTGSQPTSTSGRPASARELRPASPRDERQLRNQLRAERRPRRPPCDDRQLPVQLQRTFSVARGRPTPPGAVFRDALLSPVMTAEDLPPFLPRPEACVYKIPSPATAAPCDGAGLVLGVPELYKLRLTMLPCVYHLPGVSNTYVNR